MKTDPQCCQLVMDNLTTQYRQETMGALLVLSDDLRLLQLRPCLAQCRKEADI
jgi:hypothetical protein